jgi:Integrase zinc binding domain
MIQSDALSRRPDFIPDEDDDNDNMTMLPENLFIGLIDMDLQQQIANCETRDKDATEALTLLINKDQIILNNELNNWEVEKFEGKPILFFKGKNYVPQNEELRRNITKMFHDRETAGHPGEIETFNSIKQHYWWPG